MPLSLFLLGALIGGAIGGYLCYCIGRDKRDDLEFDNRLLKRENKELRSLLKESNEVINLQKRYINQIDKPYTMRKEGSVCNPFTDF